MLRVEYFHQSFQRPSETETDFVVIYFPLRFNFWLNTWAKRAEYPLRTAVASATVAGMMKKEFAETASWKRLM